MLANPVLRLLTAALVAALACPAAAQGIDLSGEEKPAEKTPAKKKPARKKDQKERKKPAHPQAGKKPAGKPADVPLPAPAATPAEAPPRPPEPPPARAADEAPSEQPAGKPGAPGFEGLEVGRAPSPQAKARIEGARKLLAEKEWETAALAFDAILRDRQLAEVHDEARFRLAVALARAGLHHAALSRFDEVLQRGSRGSRYFHNSLEWLFYVGRRTANESVILSRVARFAGEPFPPGAQDKFHALLARYTYERGVALREAGQEAEARKAFDEARKLSARVRGETPAAGGEVETRSAADGNLVARARFLDGLVRYGLGDAQAAVESFKDVVRLTNPRRTRQPDPRIRELAFLQLARIHYEFKQNRYAIFYYQKMPWGGPSWLEGLWESSYAYYRIGDYEKALGNLITLHSPYFRDEYFPESFLLKAIIYYENCRYPEARGILDEFGQGFEPVFEELQRTTARDVPAPAFYEQLDALARGREKTAPALRRVLKAAFTDKNIARLDVSIREVETELDRKLPATRPAFRDSALARDLRGQLGAEKKKLVEEAGARARQKLEYERDALRELLEQALRIKIEVSRKEREALEATLASGGRADVTRPYRFSAAVSDEHLFWPYEGEFWRDELGTYAYTLTRGCREGPQAVGGAR